MNQEKKRRDPICIDDGKLRLYAPALQEGARQRMCRTKLIENNPALEIDYGIKSEPRNGKEGYPVKLEIPMAPVPFQTLLELIKRVAAFKGQCGFEMENWGHPFIWSKEQGKNIRSPERLLIARISVFKRDDGMVVLGFAAKNKPNAEFEFKPDEFHPICQNGQAAPVDISSSLAATAWAEALSQVYFGNYVKSWEEPEYQKRRRLENMQRAQQRQGGGGSYQGGNNNSQYQQSQPQPSAPAGNMGNDDFDSDLPF